MLEKRIKWLKAFSKFVFSEFAKKNASSMAAELTLNNMLALVPLMTVAVSLMAIFPAFDNLNVQVQDLIFKNFLPETGLAVQEHLNEYVAKSKNLSAVGFAFLIITSLMLIRAIDRAINTVWETRNRRRGVQKWLSYWAMLTMAPILIAASLAASSYFAALPLVSKISGILTFGLPFLLIVLAFTALYMVAPFSHVKFRFAVLAATITAILFELAKYGFAIFVTKFSTYEVIYGAITAIPLFFLWVFLSWLILMFGVVICFALHRFEMKREKSEHDFISILKIMHFFAQAQSNESSVTIEQLKSKFSYLHGQTLRHLVEQLLNLNYLAKLENGQYCLKLNASDLTIGRIYRHGPWRLPNNNQTLDAEEQSFFSRHVESANQAINESLDVSILGDDSKDSNQ
ncbi:YihY family inner membrane protein [Kangiella shandongensis]|uniref:YihY family inner membrane protein n=1 Tax=Kangiella shandongensis TaxID=2763258 RepID=UPI001CBB6556|nr:YihY family inner membrane protein [Kangiella shandongensis]